MIRSSFMISRRSFLATADSALSLAAQPGPTQHYAAAYGCTFVKTPNFDWIAREGVLFKNCFTSNPKCSPCRATILTGRIEADQGNHIGYVRLVGRRQGANRVGRTCRLTARAVHEKAFASLGGRIAHDQRRNVAKTGTHADDVPAPPELNPSMWAKNPFFPTGEALSKFLIPRR